MQIGKAAFVGDKDTVLRLISKLPVRLPHDPVSGRHPITWATYGGACSLLRAADRETATADSMQGTWR
jgi:hypothetical protein